MGVTGTWEGWVPTAQDLYYNGVNSAGFTISGGEFQNTIIKHRGSATVRLNFTKNYNVRAYSRLNFKGYYILGSTSSGFIKFLLGYQSGSSSNTWGKTEVSSGATTSSIDITQLTDVTTMYYIIITYSNENSYTSRIWLS